MIRPLSKCMLLVALAVPALAVPPRGSPRAIEEAEAAQAAHPRDVAALSALAANYAVKYSNTGKALDRTHALDTLRELEAAAPGSASALAWGGLVRCVDGRDRYSKEVARQGLEKLDRAVEKEPGDIDFRLLRASIDLEVPTHFKRVDQALADLQEVLRLLRERPELGPRHDIGLPEVWLKIGQAQRARGANAEAWRAWQKAVQSGPDTPEGKRAKRLMDKNPNLAPR